jgi:hypothetical protein
MRGFLALAQSLLASIRRSWEFVAVGFGWVCLRRWSLIRICKQVAPRTKSRRLLSRSVVALSGIALHKCNGLVVSSTVAAAWLAKPVAPYKTGGLGKNRTTSGVCR